MGVLEKINQLKEGGLDDESVANKLREQGVPPSEIQDGFAQLKVKRAIASEENQETPRMQEQNTSGQFYTPRTKDIESNPQEDSFHEEEYYSPQPAPPTPQEQPYNQGYQNPQEYDQNQYANYQQYSAPNSTDTMIEVAEQVFSEKTKRMEEQLEMLREFATLAENKIESNNERIKRIEKIIDNLQIKILEKIGSYGEGIGNIQKEMEMMQDSFSKTLPKLVDKKK